MVSRIGRSGFTLAEALIALSISSVLIILVGSVFLTQNNFYSHVLLRSQVQENARAVTELVASDVRSLAPGGIILADSTRLVVRAPMATALICGRQGGSDVMVHVSGGLASIDTNEVGGYGYRDPGTGAWTYYDHTWSELYATGGNPAIRCFINGADVSGAWPEFIRMKSVESDTGIDNTVLDDGTHVLIFYRKTEFRFDNSVLVPGDRALFRGIYGSTLVEFATGMATTAQFQYRTGPTWVKYVAPASLSTVDAIRVVAQSVGKGDTSAQLGYDFGWTVDIPLANAF